MLLALSHILSNSRFKNTKVELLFLKKGSFQQQRKFQLWLCDHIVSIDQIIPGINKHARGLAILLHILVNEFYQQCLIKIIIHNLLLLTVNFKK